MSALLARESGRHVAELRVGWATLLSFALGARCEMDTPPPPDATLVEGFFDKASGEVCLLLEHPSFPASVKGEPVARLPRPQGRFEVVGANYPRQPKDAPGVTIDWPEGAPPLYAGFLGPDGQEVCERVPIPAADLAASCVVECTGWQVRTFPEPVLKMQPPPSPEH